VLPFSLDRQNNSVIKENGVCSRPVILLILRTKTSHLSEKGECVYYMNVYPLYRCFSYVLKFDMAS
jgi:hypothetical protein